jgi:hypothetical protein
MTRKPAGPYLIESSPQYAKRQHWVRVNRLLSSPLAAVYAAIAGYQDELNRMLNADAVYLGHGK